MASFEEPKFNDDLLLSQDDRELASRTFPNLFPLLDFPELRETFGRHDRPANRLKKKRQRWGIAAIAMGVVALLGASSSPLLEDAGDWPRAIGWISAFLGIVSVLIGALGIASESSKHDWFCHRLMTERLRQLHFQIMVFRLPEVLVALQDGQRMQDLLANRRTWLSAFGLRYEGHEAAKLKAVLDDSDDSEFEMLIADSSSIPTEIGSAAEDFLAAYRLLRLEHQIQYANTMLRNDAKLLPKSAAGQFRVLRAIALACIAVMFALHLWVAATLARGQAVGHLIEVVVVWLAIVMMATRAFEEGLQPGREIERYSNYRANLKRLLRQFDQTTSLPEKQKLMVETERVVYQEMRAFLLLHEDARFVL
ncbi:MAG: hypothetical protein JWQ90_1513 [Hydrocarboniphaga sp.]|uniref:hypothetical protein n=1 Tax=Hydrocarboniphaga sp. TaxID=2033016 RepID=UPI002633A31A|nr:hypothetical protein [Hydrocarboniphaga sp.]MDB5969063.1 hypothetical protein [Hydrocarboniphaga sp.]